MATENWLDAHIDQLIALRRELHADPELLYDLPRTAARIAAALRAAGCDEVVEGIGGTGVVAVIGGQSDRRGRMIGLRADMDALPIQEASGKPWASRSPGRMHACGHDGHCAMLLGAAVGLAQGRAFDGRVVLIFQPAEEGGAGARAMIEDGLFQRWPVQEVYGMHNRPNLPVGAFTIAPGPIMGSVDMIEIEIEGVGGHAAMPHQTIDTIPAAAALIQAVQAIAARSIDPLDSAVISITTIHAGDAFNVIPQTLRLSGTVRTLRAEVRDHIEARLAQAVQGIAAGYGAQGRLTYARHYPVTVNHPAETENAARAAEAVTGPARVSRTMPPTLGGEDFAFMLEARPGAMINIGNGPGPGLHHPAYDFNDDAIVWGTSYWCELVRQRLSRHAAA